MILSCHIFALIVVGVIDCMFNLCVSLRDFYHGLHAKADLCEINPAGGGNLPRSNAYVIWP